MGRVYHSNLIQQMEQDKFFVFETPIGTVNSSNTTFTLTYSPNPTKSLLVTLNGQELAVTEDYTLSADTIIFNNAPPTGSILKAEYHVTPTDL